MPMTSLFGSLYLCVEEIITVCEKFTCGNSNVLNHSKSKLNCFYIDADTVAPIYLNSQLN